MDWPEMKPLITVDDLARENATLRKRVEELERVASPWDHAAESCPTWYDGCHCTLDALRHNIERAEKAAAERDKLQADLATVLACLERAPDNHCYPGNQCYRDCREAWESARKELLEKHGLRKRS